MANEISLAEYISQAQRGYVGSVFGPDFLKKQTYFQTTNVLTATYGRKVWHALNNKTTIWNALPKVVWGPTAGWRVRTDRGSGRSRPVTETGTLPTVDVSNIENVYSLPRIVGTTFGASVQSIFTATLEGGIGDILAMEQENAQIDHVKEINQQLLAGSAYLCSNGSTTTHVVPASIGSHFKIGDTVGYMDATGSENDSSTTITVSAVSAGTVTVGTHTTATADGDLAFIKSRGGFTSLDDVVAEDAMSAGGVSGGALVNVYNITGTRTAGDWDTGAYVNYNSGVGRDLSLTLLDTSIQNIRENGGEPRLIVLGHDQYFRLERLLNSMQRYMGQEEYQVGVGDERTYPGTRTGMVLATYMGIPILPEVDCPHSVNTSDTVLGSNVYVLDTDSLELAVAQPTQYIENRDYFQANALVVRGLLYTMGELRCKNIWHQAKLADLNA